ncbi:hypothetical protein [Dyadobacter flavalbus]|uniref:hypothetical protein n=1 Tax=Dyadobacter flavalbus TaxID=2579942 RepID=UPI0013759A3C|nr:hypothetical protein [Dyadobacter flavalbus]
MQAWKPKQKRSVLLLEIGISKINTGAFDHFNLTGGPNGIVFIVDAGATLLFAAKLH